MLSGLPLFTGESVPHILADVLKSEPDWNRLPKNLHPRLKLLLERCLKKKANNRYHAMADARIDIEEVLGDPAGAELEAVAAQPLWRRALPFAATALIAGVLVGLVYDLLRPAPSASTSSSVVSDAGLRRWTVDIDTGAVAGSGLGVELDVSADGSTVAYATGGPDAAVYLRRLDQFEPTLLPGTEAARFPFFSPGGEWLGVLGGGAVRKFSVLGGPPQTLANVGRMLGVSWGDDEFIVVASAVPAGGMGMGMGAETAGSLLRLPAAGGAPEILLDAEPGSWYQWPEVLPGATGVLFTIHPEGEAATESSIAVLEMETREYRTLIFGGYNARYAPTGHIVFARAGALWAVPFDLERLQVTGTETPMVEGVQTNSLTGNVPYAFSDKGLLVYVLGADVSGANFGGNSNLIWVDREGREELLGAEPRGYIDAHLSPDGQRVAVSIFDGGAADIWVYDLNRETLSRVTFGPDPNFFPLWMPDGERILYSSTRAGEGGIFRIAANGTGQEEQLMTGTGIQFLNSISGDGRYVSVANNGDMFSMSLEGEREIVPTVQTTFNEGWDSLSPDGRWLAYGSNETGRWELYVRPFPDVDTERWQISTTGASADRALWSPDGSELYYLSAEGEFLAVAIETETTFSWSSAAVLFPWDSADAPLGVSPDGERFLAIRPNAETDDGSGSTSIAFVDNWFDDLRPLAPTE